MVLQVGLHGLRGVRDLAFCVVAIPVLPGTSARAGRRHRHAIPRRRGVGDGLLGADRVSLDTAAATAFGKVLLCPDLGRKCTPSLQAAAGIGTDPLLLCLCLSFVSDSGEII